MVNTNRTLTIAGTANQVNVSLAGAQSLAADRTWTISLPATINVNTSGNAATATLVTGTSGQLQRHDIRTISPSSITAGRLQFGFTSLANNNTAPYADFLHLRSYTDASGGSDNLVMFRKDVIGMRIYQQTFGSATAYSSFADVVISSGNQSVGGVKTFTNTPVFSEDTATLSFSSATGTKNITTGGTSNLTISPGGTTTVIGNRLNSTLTIQNNGTFSGGSGAGSNLRVEYGNILIARIANTGTGQRDAILQLLDENVTKINIAANASRGGVTYFDNGGNFLIGKSTENAANARLQVNGYVMGGLASTTGIPNNTGVTTQIAFEARGTGAGNHPSICYHKEGEYTMYLQGQTTARGLRLYAAGGETIANLFVQGDVFAYSSSDIRLKDNIQFIKNPIEKLFKIGGYSFKWNNLQDAQSGNDYGVIAQEIEAVFPELVQTRENGYKAVKYEKLVPVLIEAVKEQTRIIEQQQNQIDELKEMVNKILNK
jgi:hypothetical protein